MANEKNKINTPEKLVSLWDKTIAKEKLYRKEKETLILISLDTKLKMIGWHLISIGCKNQTICHIGEIIRPALIDNAASIAVMHNHPSGDTSPSVADVQVTKKLSDACKLMDIKLVDHVILADGDNSYERNHYSFQEQGRL